MLPAQGTLAHDEVAPQVHLRGERWNLEFLGVTQGRPLAAVVPLDALTPERLAAIGRFWAALKGDAVPPDPRISPQRRQRLLLMLRVIDARASGATYRTIAKVLFPRHDHDSASWVGTAVRETTIRLARDGMKLVRGGYTSLLRRPRRSR